MLPQLCRPPLSREDRLLLLVLARAAVSEVVLHDRILVPPKFEGRLAEASGTFVTLHCRGKLRGCVGMSSGDMALGEAVTQAAIGAVRNDRRFAAIVASELADVEIEISVLSELRPIAAGAIVVGTHGLVVSRGKNRGLLLPQVAAERAWAAERFLEETCRKAALDGDAWQQPETEVLAFTAEVFSERDEAGRTGAAGVEHGASGEDGTPDAPERKN